MTRKVDVLVVGAGPTGLGAAYQLQATDADWLLVESTTEPGGLAKSVRDRHGFNWDLGGHVLHSHFQTFDDAIADSGVEMLAPVRNGWVLTRGEWVQTPIQHHVEHLPEDLQVDAPAANLAEYYRNNFGADLYKEFFKPFTEKMWATPLEMVDHTWTSHRSGSSQRNVPSIKVGVRGQSSPGGTVTFPYPQGGTGRLWSAIAQGLDPSRQCYGVQVESFDVAGRVAHLSNGEDILYDQCVSSASLPFVAQSDVDIQRIPGPSDLLSSQALLIGLGYDGPPPPAIAEMSWIYSPDTEVAWHRATMLANYDPANAGPGRWSILFEVGRSAFRPVGKAEAIQSCQRSLEELGASASSLVSVWTSELPMGYPVPTVGRDEKLRAMDAQLIANGIRSRGRFGGWRYESCNQDYSFMQGVEAVNAALKGTPEDVYWHPERF
jgi:protoporphyrinogen oxidase